MKKILALLLVMVMVFSLAGCVTDLTPDPTAPEKPGQEQATTTQTEPENENLAKFTVTVVYADGSSKDFNYATDEVYVGPVLKAEGLIQGNEGPYGLEITHVDGQKAVYNEDKAYWALYEGEEYALQGIDTTPVKDGGTYKLVYTGA